MHIVDWLPDIRIADIFDILLVTIMVYAAAVWIRRTQAAFVAIGLLILAVVYVAVRALDLRLMAWIFQGFFAVFLVVIVVIFQEELRQLFERLAVWSLRRRHAVAPPFDPVNILVRCCADFTRDRIGALIVIPGKQPILRHIQGGIELQGRLSEPLLKSIFDPHSAGHDGAVILEGDRVTRFACHLPLSKDFQQLSRYGTRHSAALGLAELTDALTVVVSEERGQISIARDARLRPMKDTHELGIELDRFIRATQGGAPNPRHTAWRLLRENWVEKLVSFAFVVTLWYLFVPGSRPETVTYSVPVSVTNLPADMHLDAVEPAEVSATFSGPRRSFYLFGRERLRVTVDASMAQLGRRTFEIPEQAVRHPPEVTLEDISPDKVRISVSTHPPTPVPTANGGNGKKTP